MVKSHLHRHNLLSPATFSHDPTIRIVSPLSTRRKIPRHETVSHAPTRACSSIGDCHHEPARGSSWVARGRAWPTFRQRRFPTKVVPLRQASIAPWFPYPKPATALFSLFCVRKLYLSGFSCFINTQRHLQDFRSCFAPSSSCVSSFRYLIVVVS